MTTESDGLQAPLHLQYLDKGPRFLRPLRNRNFALLFVASGISLLGDGIYLVAVAWQAYSLTNSPSALALVGVASTVPQLVFLLLGGALSDRLNRRRVMVVADGVRAISIGAIGFLSVSGLLQPWQLFGLVAIYGIGSALFNPAYTAFLPSIVDPSELGQANALLQASRPLAVRFAGPAVGGLLVATLGTGTGFLVDAASFVVSMIAVLSMHTPAAASKQTVSNTSGIMNDVREGLRFVRGRRWLVSSLLASALGLLFYLGPVQVLLPFLVKNYLGGDASDLGFILAAGGLGALSASLLVGQRGLPVRRLPMMYLMWAAAASAPAGYALVDGIWQAAAISAVSIGAMTAGQIIWTTSLQEVVPAQLLGRVVSVDLLASNALVPFSFALTGPIAGLLGARTTMLFVGLAGSLVILIFLPVACRGAPSSLLRGEGS